MEVQIKIQWVSFGIISLCGLLDVCHAYVGSTPPSGMACLPCQSLTCPDWRSLDCNYGYTLDGCKCCYQCAVGPGKVCGGSQNVYGTCGIGLYCKYSSSKQTFEETIQRFGKCTSVKGLPGSENFRPPGVVHEADLVSKLPPVDSPVTKPTSVKETRYTPKTTIDDKMLYNQFPSFSFAPESSTGPMMKDDPNYNSRFGPTPNPKCEPLCTAEYCTSNKRAVCSALNKVHSKGGTCNSECHHTSCLTCGYAADIPACGQCDGEDKQCLKKFGICIKEARLKARRSAESYINAPIEQDGVKYVCTIPDCPM